MLFNSYIFVLLFLPAMMGVWWALRLPTNIRMALLVIFSYLFYGYWDYRFVSLLMFSTLVDFHAGHQIAASHRAGVRRFWLLASLTSNLGLLAFFKYAGFLASSLNEMAAWIHDGRGLPVPAIILPAGISFYTFQTLSYTIDIYRGRARPATTLLHFAAYVAMFPQLIAGPIVRYVELEEQLRDVPKKVKWPQMATGIYFFTAGMCQKVLFADTIAGKINPLLEQPEALQFGTSWFCLLGYGCQLYFDFAGYSNMAVGLGHMLGFVFPQNFDSPYKSRDISEFWRRWHKTLSYFLRDYLFIPLGGSRYGQWLTLRNLLIVMFLGGLWHGAGWNFVLWGLFHGGLLVMHQINRSRDIVRLPSALAVLLTFVCVNLGWVLFRSPSLEFAGRWYRALWGGNGIEMGATLISAVGGLTAMGCLLALLVVVFGTPNVWEIRFRPNRLWAVGCALGLVFCILRFSTESPFLYFQF